MMHDVHHHGQKWSRLLFRSLCGRSEGRKTQTVHDQFKFTVALEAVKGLKTINQIAGKFNAHPLLCRHMAQPN